jgi:hypothetical protein
MPIHYASATKKNIKVKEFKTRNVRVVSVRKKPSRKYKYYVKKESWKGKSYIVARDNGRIVDRVKYKKGILENLKNRFEKTGSLRKNYHIKTSKIGKNKKEVFKFNQYGIKGKRVIRLQKPKQDTGSYRVGYFLKGKGWIYAQAKSREDARNKALGRVSMEYGSINYDEDKGKKIVEVRGKGYREGIVDYFSI